MASGQPSRVLPDDTDDLLRELELRYPPAELSVSELITKHNDPETIRRIAIRSFIRELQAERKKQ